MTQHFWSFTLQWSRFGLNALVFLLAAKFLSLEEIGAFAIAFAPIKLTQGIHKAGVIEAVVIKAASPTRLNTLFGFSLISGITIGGAFFLCAPFFGLHWELTSLGFIPILLGVSSVSEGLLKKHLRIRALALRTATAQGIAACVTLLLLFNGAGAGALVTFAILNTGFSACISVALAQWCPNAVPTPRHLILSSRVILHIAGRDIINSGILPVTQIAIGLRFGLIEAGAFQIATRLLSMFDALTLSPLRFLALPKLKGISNPQVFKQEIENSFRHSLTLACWVWFGVVSATTEALELVIGSGPAIATTPILQILIPLGLSAAVTMPFAQALIARGQTRFVFNRAILVFILSVCFAMPMFLHSTFAVTAALSVANLCVLAWFLFHAFGRLELPKRVLFVALQPVTAGMLMLTVLTALTLSLVTEILIGTTIYCIILCLCPWKSRIEIET